MARCRQAAAGRLFVAGQLQPVVYWWHARDWAVDGKVQTGGSRSFIRGWPAAAGRLLVACKRLGSGWQGADRRQPVVYSWLASCSRSFIGGMQETGQWMARCRQAAAGRLFVAGQL